jgi:hypothetical protein
MHHILASLLLGALFNGFAGHSSALGPDTCDDPFPALVVTAADSAGNRIVPDRVEVFRGAESQGALSCGDYECVTSDLPTGTYRVVATLGNERLEQGEISVENSYACSHEVTQIRFTFQGSR